MGQPKQLLPYGGVPLVAHACRAALDSGASQVVLVVGHEADAICGAVVELPVQVVRNEAWASGMGSSIVAGVAALSDVDAAIIALADQPRVTSQHFRALVERLSEGIAVASSYGGVVGPPCAFSSSLFWALLQSEGDVGARALIRALPNVQAVECPDAALDVDTPEDYEAL